MSHASLTVQVHEDTEHLARLLASLEATPGWRAYPVLVVDNSCNKDTRKAVARITQKVTTLDIRVVGAELWVVARERIAIRLNGELDDGAAAVLDAIALGNPGWNAHLGRMAGMILTRALFPDVVRTLHLDADMVIPQGLLPELDRLPSFCGYQIGGCPDLSRLEWIDLAALACSSAEGLAKRNYAEQLRYSLVDEALDAILAHYTELMPLADTSRLPATALPPRDEFHGAAYVLDPARFSDAPYGEWYDNDWTFFEMVGGPAAGRPPLHTSLLHLSRRKKVLAADALDIEERGKALHAAALDRGEDEARLLRAAAHRRQMVANVAARLASAGPALANRYGSSTAKEMHAAVSRLAAIMTDEQVVGLAPALGRFRRTASAWPRLLNAALAIGPQLLTLDKDSQA